MDGNKHCIEDRRGLNENEPQINADERRFNESGLLKERQPQTNADERRLNELSEKIIGAAFEVSNVLGTGFLEKVYENALNVELKLRGLKTFQQAPLKVYYKNELVGDYIADILVENEIIIEVKQK